MSDHVRSQHHLPVLALKGEPVALAALARGLTIKNAANQAGISERTLRRRLGDSSYKAELHKSRARILDGVVGALVDGASEAVETLRDLCRTGPASAKLGAARSILEYSISLSENVETKDRIAALEELILAKSGDVTFRREVTVDG